MPHRTPPKQWLTARRILVVDDNRDAAESLAFQGHETHLAQNGLEAVELAATLQPDVILLDIGLPHLDGYEAARRIRQQNGDKPLMLVALPVGVRKKTTTAPRRAASTLIW